MSLKRLMVYGCSFSSGTEMLNPDTYIEVPEGKTNYASLTGQNLGYDKVVLNGVGGYTNQEIANRIIIDMHGGKIEPDDHILIQQTSHWRKNVGDNRFDGVTMDTPDVMDYNHLRYSNDDFLKEILHHKPALYWYFIKKQYKIWGGGIEVSTDTSTISKVRKSFAEWDLLLINMCFLSTALSALKIKFPGSKIFVMPFVPLTGASYEKLVKDLNGHELINLLYNDWATSIDTNRFHILTVNPMNFYYNNPKYWDDNNLKNYRKIDHGTEEFHSIFSNLLCEQMKPFYD